MPKVNAAIGLARQSSTAGWPVYLEILKQAGRFLRQASGDGFGDPQKHAESGRGLAWGNGPKSRNRNLIGLLESLARRTTPNVRIRTDAVKTLQTLKAQS